MKMKVSITNVQQDGLRFSANVTVGWPEDPKGGRSFHAHTNRNGCGLWTGDSQCYGTSQFKGRTKDAFRAALRRAFQ